MIFKRILIVVGALALLVGVAFVIQAESDRLTQITIHANVPSGVVVGQEIRVPITISTQGEVINALELYGKVYPDELELKAIESTDSFIKLWIKDQPHIDAVTGDFSLRGGIPKTGFQGTGVVGTLVITPKKVGAFRITFDSKSRILKHDGRGTTEPARLDDIIITVRQ